MKSSPITLVILIQTIICIYYLAWMLNHFLTMLGYPIPQLTSLINWLRLMMQLKDNFLNLEKWKEFLAVILVIQVVSQRSILGALRDSFSGFACWGDLVLSGFQNQFCACSSQPGQRYESG